MLTEVSHFVSEVVNMVPHPYQPYVGTSAFTHKGGLHTAAVLKNDGSYQHVAPERVGNQRRMVVSELGGSRGLQREAEGASGFEFELSRDEARSSRKRSTTRRRWATQFEGADASLRCSCGAASPATRRRSSSTDFWIVERALSATAPTTTARCRPRRWPRCASTARCG